MRAAVTGPLSPYRHNMGSLAYSTRAGVAWCGGDAGMPVCRVNGPWGASCITPHQNAGAVQCRSALPTALFLSASPTLEPPQTRLYRVAAEAGFRSFVVPACCVATGSNCLCARGGYEVGPDGACRQLVRECLVPDLVVHDDARCRTQERLIEHIAEYYPETLLSFHPEFRSVSSKSGAELAIAAATENGMAVSRPETLLLNGEGTAERLDAWGVSGPVIFKPSDGGKGRGIYVSTPATFEAVKHEVASLSRAYVAQKLVADALRIDGKRFDLRLYVLIEQLDPLSFQLHKEGIVKVAAQADSGDGPIDKLSILTNCDFRMDQGAPVENLTVEALVRRLRGRLKGIDALWGKLERLTAEVLSAFARWPAVRSTLRAQDFVVGGLDLLLVEQDEEVEPLFLEFNYGSFARRDYGPPEVDAGLARMQRAFFSSLLRRAEAGKLRRSAIPTPAIQTSRPVAGPLSMEGLRERTRLIAIPTNQNGAADDSASPSLTTLASTGKTIKLGLEDAARSLGTVSGRGKLVELVRGYGSSGAKLVQLLPADENLAGLELRARPGTPDLWDASFVPGRAVDGLCHPLSSVLPRVEGFDGTVSTAKWPEARFAYLNELLVGPKVRGRRAPDVLLGYLGRMIADAPDGDPLAHRYVETGVGRSYLVDFVRIEDRSEFVDFSALGIGLTPYSVGGYAVTSSPSANGLTSINRALHRSRCAERLDRADCRVPMTAAIVELPGLEREMPDNSRAPCAILVRGFRTVLRVEQLDPLAGSLYSHACRRVVERFLSRLSGAPSHICMSSCVRELACGFAATNWRSHDVALRVGLIQDYAPVLLDLARQRLASEWGRDPTSDVPDLAEYTSWFARQMGRQLGVFRQLRFLYDYRLPESIARARHAGHEGRRPCGFSNALQETNVTLMAEFADLDTGIFVDSLDDETLRLLLISREQFFELESSFEELHRYDVQSARAITQTVTSIAHRGDPEPVAEAVAAFEAAYAEVGR